MSDDDYEPALDSTTTEETGVESDPVVKRAPSPAAVAAAAVPAAAPAAEKIGQPPGEDDDARIEQGPRAPRSWSGKSRALFKAVVKQVQAGEVDVAGELEPMQHTPAVAAPAATPAPAAPAATPAAPPIAAPPPPAPPGLPPLPELPLAAAPGAAQPVATPVAPDPGHAEREAAIAAREAALVEREKLLPDRLAIVENPAGALVGWLRDTHGITEDAEMRTAIADLVTELSEIGLKVTLPTDVKSALESRKALRSVKAYRASLDQREQALVKQRADADKAAADTRAADEQKRLDTAYIARLGELIAPAAAQHKFLHDPEVTGGLSPAAVVYEVLKEQKRIGHPPDLAKATAYANDYYRQRAEAVAKKAAHFQSLLAPAAPTPAVAAPTPAAASPGGAPGPAPTPAAKPAPPTVEWDPSDLPMDRQQRRQQSLARIVAARKAAAAGA